MYNIDLEDLKPDGRVFITNDFQEDNTFHYSVEELVKFLGL